MIYDTAALVLGFFFANLFASITLEYGRILGIEKYNV